MPVPSLEQACPDCRGNLHYEDTINHPQRRGYVVHTYKCLGCGPMMQVTQGDSEPWIARWDKYPIEGERC